MHIATPIEESYKCQMKVTYRYSESIFAPTQVEDITGVTTATQRLWRHREILKEQKYGRGCFSAQELVEIFLIRELERHCGQDLKAAGQHATRIAPFVLGYAVAEYGAWEVLYSKNEKKALELYLTKMMEDFGPRSIGIIMGFFKKYQGRYSIWSSDSWALTDDLNVAFSADTSKASVVLDLATSARAIVHAAMTSSETALYCVADVKMALHEPELKWRQGSR